MHKYYKRICVSASIILIISFIGFIICVPFAIHDTTERMMQISYYTLIPIITNIDANSDTIKLSNKLYGDIIFKQSPNNTAYIENYLDPHTNQHEINVSYSEGNKAIISLERTYGKFILEPGIIERLIVKQMQNYPDAVIYIPTNINIEVDMPYILPDDIEFKNKETLFAEYEKKIEEQYRADSNSYEKSEQETSVIQEELE